MKNNAVRVSISLLIIGIAFINNACNEESKPVEKPSPKPTEEIIKVEDETRFPNERSELALYMRNFYNDLKANKKNYASEGTFLDIDWSNKYANIISATPTDSNDSGPLFEAFANQFLLDLENFQNADKENKMVTYNALIESCLACHMEHCGGPMPAIRKLKMSEKVD